MCIGSDFIKPQSINKMYPIFVNLSTQVIRTELTNIPHFLLS